MLKLELDAGSNSSFLSLFSLLTRTCGSKHLRVYIRRMRLCACFSEYSICLFIFLYFTLERLFTSSKILLNCYKVACALLLSGQSLDDYAQVKQILVEMGVLNSGLVILAVQLIFLDLNSLFFAGYPFTLNVSSYIFRSG